MRSRSSRTTAALLAGLTFVASLLLLAAILFFPILWLAGPHSDVLPQPLAVLVVALAWIVLAGIPSWLAIRVYRSRLGRS